MFCAMPDWFVAQTLPQHERLVVKLLAAFKPYLPQIKVASGRIAPLFPGYLFIPALEFWSPIKNTVGVRCLLMSGIHPAKISESVITGWRSRERGGLVRLPPPPKYRKGERLTITRGTLRHRSCLYVGMSGKDREKVLIEMLGTWVPLNIPTADLASDQSKSSRALRETRNTA